MSSIHHTFDINLAEKFGIEEAILIHHFQHWISLNQRMGKNLIEERTWTYQTLEYIAAHFPYLNKNKVKYALNCLVKKGVLKKGNFNKRKLDKTLWFAFEDQDKFIKINTNSKNVYERQNCLTRDKIVPALPDTKEKDTKDINIKESKPKKAEHSSLASKEAHVLSKYMYEKIKERDDKAKEPNYNKWAKDFDKLLETRDYNTIKTVIDRVYDDIFWCSNILSPAKLDKQFTKLLLHFKNKDLKDRISFNKSLAFDLRKGLIKNKRKEEGYLEIQPDSIYDRNNQQYYSFELPSSEFIKKINQAFNVKFSLTNEEILKYG